MFRCPFCKNKIYPALTKCECGATFSMVKYQPYKKWDSSWGSKRDENDI